MIFEHYIYIHIHILSLTTCFILTYTYLNIFIIKKLNYTNIQGPRPMLCMWATITNIVKNETEALTPQRIKLRRTHEILH